MLSLLYLPKTSVSFGYITGTFSRIVGPFLLCALHTISPQLFLHQLFCLMICLRVHFHSHLQILPVSRQNELQKEDNTSGTCKTSSSSVRCGSFSLARFGPFVALILDFLFHLFAQLFLYFVILVVRMYRRNQYFDPLPPKLQL